MRACISMFCFRWGTDSKDRVMLLVMNLAARKREREDAGADEEEQIE